MQPLESLEGGWQQRSFSAAGLPSLSRNSTMSSPSRRNGFGPSFRSSSDITAYQKRRSTVCLVVSMAFILGLYWSSSALGHAVGPGAGREPRQHHHGEKQ